MEIIEKQVEKVKEVPADNYGYNSSSEAIEDSEKPEE